MSICRAPSHWGYHAVWAPTLNATGITIYTLDKHQTNVCRSFSTRADYKVCSCVPNQKRTLHGPCAGSAVRIKGCGAIKTPEPLSRRDLPWSRLEHVSRTPMPPLGLNWCQHSLAEQYNHLQQRRFSCEANRARRSKTGLLPAWSGFRPPLREDHAAFGYFHRCCC